MAHTYLHPGAKKQIVKILKNQGYPTYAWLLDPFDVYLTDDPNVIAYMIPNKAVIVVNELLDINQVSTVVRHEILHEYLTHAKRTAEFEKSHPGRVYNHEVSNIAADFEISNRGYTDADKDNMRRVKVGDQTLTALVTEDEHPGWEDKTFEEMYDELTKQLTQDTNQMMKELQPLIDAMNKMSPQELDDLLDQAQQQAQGGENDQSDQGSDGKSSPEDGDEEGDSDEGGKANQNSASGQSNQEAKDLQDAAQNAANEIKDIQDQQKQDAKDSVKEPFKSDKELDDQVARAARVEEIQKRLDDIKAKQQLLDETDRVVQKEKIKKIQQKELKQASDPLRRFRMNFQNFIKDQISEYRGDTWHRPNKNYVGSDYIMQGRTMFSKTNIPKINVYWDVSGSFSDPAKTAGARAAIATINQYVKKGQVVVDAYYFADKVSDNKKSAGGGTAGQPILNHIQQTKPTNVIVVTDGDIGDCYSDVTVPGAVWMLFFDSQSENLIEHLHGKKQTKHYMIYDY